MSKIVVTVTGEDTVDLARVMRVLTHLFDAGDEWDGPRPDVQLIRWTPDVAGVLPLDQAPDNGPVILVSKQDSPMGIQALDDLSIELGWKGNGQVKGFHTARYGFFSLSGEGNPGGFTWEGFLPIGGHVDWPAERKPSVEEDTILDAVRAYGAALDAFAEFEREHPNDSTKRWEAVFDAKNNARDRVLALAGVTANVP